MYLETKEELQSSILWSEHFNAEVDVIEIKQNITHSEEVKNFDEYCFPITKDGEVIKGNYCVVIGEGTQTLYSMRDVHNFLLINQDDHRTKKPSIWKLIYSAELEVDETYRFKDTFDFHIEWDEEDQQNKLIIH